MKTCAECGKAAAMGANICPYCRHELRENPFRWILIIVALAVILGFLATRT